MRRHTILIILSTLAVVFLFVGIEITIWTDPAITAGGAIAITGTMFAVAAFVAWIAGWDLYG